MTTIIAGRFEQQADATETMEELVKAGFGTEAIVSFYCNPPGRHDAHPLGGDHTMSPGAKESDKGVAAGAVAGAVAGLAATPALGPVGPVTGGLLGAYVGGLIGGLSEMKEKGQVGKHGEDIENFAPLRHAGVMVAVAVDDHQAKDHAVSVLHACGAMDIECAEGTIEEGDWVDFDPVAPPNLVRYSSHAHAPESVRRQT